LDKALGEVAVLEANRTPETFLTCSLRPAGIFGEGDVITLFRMLQVRGLKKYFQIGNNKNLFDSTHVKNVAYAHLLAANALLQTHNLPTKPLDTEKVDGEAFMITNGTPVFFWDFVRKVWQERGLPEDKVYSLSWVVILDGVTALWIAGILEFIMGLFGKIPTFNKIAVRTSSMQRYFKIDKARHRLGYEPIVPLEEGIVSSVKEVKERLIKLKLL
jgi:sterol-4alpha-carboxylate 3-dehydrogenase (decarboxylating)